MIKNLSPFHLAFPVKNLLETKLFYTNFLGCTIGRTSNEWIDFNFYGHQITAHLSPDACAAENNNIKIDKKPLEVFYSNPNFGGDVLKWKAEIYMPIKE